MSFVTITGGLVAIINVIAFFTIFYDKRISRNNETMSRIPEGVIFFLASIFGGVGVYFGMLLFRHKTKKWYFQIGIPLLIIQNFSLIYLLKELGN